MGHISQRYGMVITLMFFLFINQVSANYHYVTLYSSSHNGEFTVNGLTTSDIDILTKNFPNQTLSKNNLRILGDITDGLNSMAEANYRMIAFQLTNRDQKYWVFEKQIPTVAPTVKPRNLYSMYV